MRIIVGLLEHIGDIVACEPVTRYLRINHPEAHLAWAVAPAYRELVDTNPNVDETVVLECLTDWIKLTKHQNYDRIVDLHVNYRICQHCGIPLIKTEGNPFVNAYEWFDYGSLIEAFTVGAGLPRLSAHPQLYLKEEHGRAVDQLGLPEQFCVVHVQSSADFKDWDKSNWQNLCDFIDDNLGISVVEVGSGHTSLTSSKILDLVGRLPILQTAEVIRRARFFVGIDSGPAHLANALKIPGVVLLGRMGFFRQYMPFSGFYAGDSPQVKIVRNPAGPVRDLSLQDVRDAVHYVANISEHCWGSKHARSDNASLGLPEGSLATSPPGAREDILTSGLFDAGWYAVHYPEVACSGLDALDHFLTTGAAAMYSPGPDFDTRRYLEANPDVLAAGINPLLHYLGYGRHEGRARSDLWNKSVGDTQEIARTLSSTAPTVGTDFADSAVSREPRSKTHPAIYPRTFAFYLPQFHPIPENDWAHGAGFSEWHNVMRARPLFPGHYQPRFPGELGFYDLRSTEVLERQVALARQHGISGFCFYYYYFNGKKVLYRPIENFLQSDIEFPFFFLWANENWSKRWDGGDRDIIISQTHSSEDDIAFIRQLLPAFEDPRYVKIEGRPLLLVYKPHLFPNVVETAETWRNEIERHGYPGLYLVLVDDWQGEVSVHPRHYGFDAAYEIPSNLIPDEVLYSELGALDLEPSFSGRIVDYAKFAGFHMSRSFPEYKRFRTVMLPWDNTARYGARAVIHVNGDGDDYRLWLIQALIDTYRRYPPEERIVFLHSWNEWCEGTYLEPDGKYGRKFLEETKEAIQIAKQTLDLVDGAVENSAAIADLIRMMQRKDEAVSRAVHAIRMTLQNVRAEAGDLRLQNQQVRAQLDTAHAQLNAVFGSNSWRVTSPLRAASKWLLPR